MFRENISCIHYRAIHLVDFEDACRNLFCSGRLCLGFPQDDDEEEATKPFLVSQTPIPRKYSRACLERLEEKDDANVCRQCRKMYGFGDEEISPSQSDMPTPNPSTSSEVIKIEEEPEIGLPVPEASIDYVPEVPIDYVPEDTADYVGQSGKLFGEQEEIELTANPEGVEVVHTAQPGLVGEGDLSVRIHAEGRTYSFGPVNLRTEEEVQLLWELLKDNYNARNHRLAHRNAGCSTRQRRFFSCKSRTCHTCVVCYVKIKLGYYMYRDVKKVGKSC